MGKLLPVCIFISLFIFLNHRIIKSKQFEFLNHSFAEVQTLEMPCGWNWSHCSTRSHYLNSSGAGFQSLQSHVQRLVAAALTKRRLCVRQEPLWRPAFHTVCPHSPQLLISHFGIAARPLRTVHGFFNNDVWTSLQRFLSFSAHIWQHRGLLTGQQAY